jgi:hypothetical protein
MQARSVEPWKCDAVDLTAATRTARFPRAKRRYAPIDWIAL